MNGKMGLERRAIIDHAVAKGYEIVPHNYEQSELLTDFQMDENAERQVIRNTLQAYRDSIWIKASSTNCLYYKGMSVMASIAERLILEITAGHIEPIRADLIP